MGAASCSPAKILPGSAGKQQRYYFSVQTTDGGPTVPIPNLAAGGAELTILARPDVDTLAQFASVKTSDAAVCQATLQGEEIVLKSGVPGRAELSLLDTQGNSLDSVDVAVTSTTRIERNSTNDSYLLAESVTSEEFRTFADDQATYGRGALRAIFSGTLRGASEPLSLARADLLTAPVLLTGSVGTGTLTVSTVEGRSLAVAWRVIPPEQVDTVMLKVISEMINLSTHERTTQLGASARVKTGARISGARCAWTASSSAVSFTPPTQKLGPLQDDLIDVKVEGSGMHTVTCTIGGVASSVMVSRP
jgi:hypothetical protein